MRLFRRNTPRITEHTTPPLPATGSPAIPSTTSGTNPVPSPKTVPASGIDPDADVTLADITHVRVGNLQVGDTLLSYGNPEGHSSNLSDGNPEGTNTSFPWKMFNFNATITRISRTQQEALHFFFDDGRHLTTSAHHRFVSGDKWGAARDLTVGSEVPVAIFAAGPEGNAVAWGGTCTVTAIEPLGVLDLVDIETSTGTFFAIGLAVGC